MGRRVAAFAPGRVNLIGEHTDYNDGLSLPFAIALGVTVTAEPLPGHRMEVHALDLGEHDSFDRRDPGARDGWRAFARGATAELARARVRPPACRLEISASLPRSVGLSSSAALSVALCLALTDAAGAGAPDRIELARLCSRIESDWVGARTGLLDQLASLHGREGHALRIDFRETALRPVPLELARHRLAVLPSGASRELARSGYNARREESARACRALGLTSLRDAGGDEADGLPEPLRRRVRHVLSENARVDLMVTALEAGDLDEAGRLLDASHRSLRDDYEVSLPAVERAREVCRAAGALGARVVGGGFGGSVLALFPPGRTLPARAIAVSPSGAARMLPGT
ncbi:MAG TPA: galactokinase family protein [Thermoleophilaceae bacterium]|nr:galactokinase family protein [Thermoleophilaceae bacterium]